MPDQDELIAFSPSALIALEDGTKIPAIASVHATPDGAVRIVVETEQSDEPHTIVLLPAGSRAIAAAGSEVAA